MFEGLQDLVQENRSEENAVNEEIVAIFHQECIDNLNRFSGRNALYEMSILRVAKLFFWKIFLKDWKTSWHCHRHLQHNSHYFHA